ncbi:HxlR family transcriptional regulator [Deltaproteobacteria bacterium Smac51]|nr:HxlR family transcriptional regulator [Deltaproteobacteria bacterium Smac51]
MELALQMVGGKYKLNILCHLSENENLRFGELKKVFHSISHKVLTSQLREMENDLLINRVVHPTVPPKVEYSLTRHGQKLLPVLLELNKWGQYYMENVMEGDNADSADADAATAAG